MSEKIPITEEALALLTGPVVEDQQEEVSNTEQKEEVPVEAAPAPKEDEEELEAQPEAQEEKDVSPKEDNSEEEKEDATAWNKRFAALARKEREVTRLQKETTLLKQQVDSQKQLLDEGLKYKQVFNESVAMFKRDPRAYIKDLCDYVGMPENTFYTNYTKQVLNDGQQAPDLMFNSLKEEIAALKQELAGREKSKAENEQKANIDRFKNNIKEHVFVSADKYPNIKKYNAIDEVFDYIEQDFRAKGSDPAKALSIEAACNEFERALSYYQQIDDTRTVTKSSTSQPKKATKTLSNKDSASEVSTAPAEESFEQRKRRIAREAGLAG